MPLLEVRRGQGDWIYKIYSPDTAHDELGNVGVFKEFWDSKRGTEALPAWSDVEPETSSKWHGWFVVGDISPAETHLAILRVWEELLVRTFGIDSANEQFKDFVGILYDDNEPAFWDELRSTHNFLTCTGTMNWLPSDHHYHDIPYTFITLPLADDGQTPDRYATALQVC